MIQKLFITLLLVFFIAASSVAQLTTANINGKIRDQKTNEEIPGATIGLVHVPTGTKYFTATGVDGRYNISNINPGGPYTLSISFVGYSPRNIENLYLSLGPNNDMNVHIQETTNTLAEVVIKGEKGGLKTGSSTEINELKLKTMPTLSRSISDMTRLSPQSSNNSFAGTNFRYNNVTIDGTINNDAIGFSPSLGGATGTSGMPGSSTRTSSISLDAIQDIQVYIAPFDVKVGNFLGGSINAVTRSGTNQLHGSVYGFGRNSVLTGPNNAGDKSKMPTSYYDYQTGFRIGLPLIKDKLFFFTNEEITHRQEPIYYGAGYKDANGNSLGLLDVATAGKITDYLKNNYGFDPGTTQEYNIHSGSTKFFNRLDWNINSKHQLSFRNNTTVSEATNLERDAQNFRFGSMDFKQNNVQSSTVAELKSHINNSVSNNLVVGYSSVHDYRTPTSTNFDFPQTEISYKGGTIFLGNDREATVFNMKQKTIELTDNFMWFKGKHTFTVGTHNEFYTINYGFVNALNGRISYKSVDDFLAGKVNRVRGSYNFTDNSRDYNFNNPYAQFNVNLFSLYGQDDIQVTDKLRISPGLRFDLAQVPNGPKASTKTQTTPMDANAGTTYTSTPLSKVNNKIFGQVLVSPRIGFNYDVKGDKSIVIRGGSGIFTGRIPFAWLGYAFYNDGVGYGSYDLNNIATKTGLKGDVLKDGAKTYAFNNGQGSQVQVDAIDNNFKMPQALRNSLAVDYSVDGYKFTIEGLYTKVINDLKFQQVNLKDSVKYYSYDTQHQMPIYLSGGASGQKINTAFSNAYMLTNTNQGHRYSLTAQVAKAYSFGLNFSAAYTYAKALDITNGIRNSMESNWQLNQSLSPNNPKLSFSNFDVRNRIVATLGYNKKWNGKQATNISAVFTSQSGTPFTWGFVNSTLANTPQAAGLAYIFKDATEATKYMVDTKDGSGNIITAATQAQNFMDFVNADKYLATRKGDFTERNGGRTPWNTTMDIRIMHDFGIVKNHNIQVSLDIINFTNLLNAAWGKYYFVSSTFNSTSSLGLTRVNSGTATDPTFNFTKPNTPYSVDQMASRYQAQLGLRYSF